uniref:hypothetical protein n=1 Tax=Streptomyces sp. NBC_01592 TaxID=2975889 RepID=UPI002F915733
MLLSEKHGLLGWELAISGSLEQRGREHVHLAAEDAAELIAQPVHPEQDVPLSWVEADVVDPGWCGGEPGSCSNHP